MVQGKEGKLVQGREGGPREGREGLREGRGGQGEEGKVHGKEELSVGREISNRPTNAEGRSTREGALSIVHNIFHSPVLLRLVLGHEFILKNERFKCKRTMFAKLFIIFL